MVQSRDDELLHGVDFKRIKQLLNECQRHHVECSANLPGHPINARVIDCLDMSLVPLLPDMNYVALGYVWGRQPETQSPVIPPAVGEKTSDEAVPWVLPKRLPRTIDDSIKAVRALGLRYVWIDRYCVQQVHSVDKLLQIGLDGKDLWTSFCYNMCVERSR
jgi:hypothetical protein